MGWIVCMTGGEIEQQGVWCGVCWLLCNVQQWRLGGIGAGNDESLLL